MIETRPLPPPHYFWNEETEVVEEAKGLTVEALKKSRVQRQSLIDKLGLIPTSIFKRDPREQLTITQDTFIEERGGGYEKHNKEMKGDLRSLDRDKNEFMLVNSGLRIQGRTGYLSRFPQNVGRVLIEVYCPEGGTIYDPFAGHNSRMQLAFRCKRNYIGVDLCAEYMKLNRELRERLLNRPGFEKPTSEIKLIEGSSSKVDLPSNCADFTVTSPPYWDLEYYGPEAEQLGTGRTYEDFLEALYPHIVENERILKPGAFCCWCINDFRKNKLFYAYHIDLYNRFTDAGFKPFNIYIIDLVSVVQASFTRDIIEHKIIPKQHEYILVFQKRGG
jgi:DNA modification methylase